MLTISVEQLRDAITAAPVYKQPMLNTGAQYIYDKLLGYHKTGIPPKLSEINFEAFDIDDVDGFLTFNTNMGRLTYEAGQIAQSFNNIEPAVVAGIFV